MKTKYSVKLNGVLSKEEQQFYEIFLIVLAIMKIQIKTILSFHLITVRMTNIKNDNKCWMWMLKSGTLSHY